MKNHIDSHHPGPAGDITADMVSLSNMTLITPSFVNFVRPPNLVDPPAEIQTNTIRAEEVKQTPVKRIPEESNKQAQQSFKKRPNLRASEDTIASLQQEILDLKLQIHHLATDRGIEGTKLDRVKEDLVSYFKNKYEESENKKRSRKDFSSQTYLDLNNVEQLLRDRKELTDIKKLQRLQQPVQQPKHEYQQQQHPNQQKQQHQQLDQTEKMLLKKLFELDGQWTVIKDKLQAKQDLM